MSREQPEVVMVALKQSNRTPTGNPQQPYINEVKDVTKAFSLDTTIRELAEFVLGKRTNVAQIVLDNSGRDAADNLVAVKGTTPKPH